MKLLYTVCALFLATSVCALPLLNSEVSVNSSDLEHIERIVGGVNCGGAGGVARYLVKFNIVFSNNKVAFCTGTRINVGTQLNWFATAAHCVLSISGKAIIPERSTAFYASPQSTPPQQDAVRIQEVWIPKAFDTKSFVHDIAIVRTTVPPGLDVNDGGLIPAANLGTTAIVEDNEEYVILGYGQLNQDGLFPARCQRRDVFVRDIDDCIAVAKGLIAGSDDDFFDDDKQICTISQGFPGVDVGGSSPCVGDDGGPLFGDLDNGDGDAVLVGVYSYNAQRCGNAGYPSFYTNVKEYDDDIIAIAGPGTNPDDWVLLVSSNTR